MQRHALAGQANDALHAQIVGAWRQGTDDDFPAAGLAAHIGGAIDQQAVAGQQLGRRQLAALAATGAEGALLGRCRFASAVQRSPASRTDEVEMLAQQKRRHRAAGDDQRRNQSQHEPGLGQEGQDRQSDQDSQHNAHDRLFGREARPARLRRGEPPGLIYFPRRCRGRPETPFAGCRPSRSTSSVFCLRVAWPTACACG